MNYIDGHSNLINQPTVVESQEDMERKYNMERRRQLLKLLLRTQLLTKRNKGKVRYLPDPYPEINIVSFTSTLVQGGLRGRKVIVDSGTSLHLVQERDWFESVGKEKVRIRGVGGTGIGFKGVLKQNQLGASIPAVWCPDLPVAMLISTEGLKRDFWETHMELEGNYLSNRRCGTVLPLQKTDSGLPQLELDFDEEETAFICSPCIDAGSDGLPSFNASFLPHSLKKATHETLTDLQEDIRKKNSTSRLAKSQQHWRMCHFHEPNSKVVCHDCLLHKGRKASHSSQRPEKYTTPAPLLLVSTDFFGPVKPSSFRGNKWAMLFICDKCGYTHGKAIQRKSQAPDVLEEFIKEIRQKCGVKFGDNKNSKGQIVLGGIHSDNEPVLKSVAWRAVCDRYNIDELHSVPYSPQMNGTVERFVSSIKSALRTTCAHADPRCWDFALEHVIKVWNLRSKHAPDGSCASPQEVINEMTDNPLSKVDVPGKRKYLRRFGCLTYFKPHLVKPDHETGTALQPKRKRGIFLGFGSRNSSWLVGCYQNSKLHVYETRSATFCEEILVRNVEELAEPEPPLLARLIDLSDVSAREQSVAGTEKSVVGNPAK